MAPTIKGTSVLCQCEDALVNSLANSSNFWTFTGATSEEQAAESVYIGELPSPVNTGLDEYTDQEYADFFPLALIYDGDDGGVSFDHSSDGGPFGYVHSTTLYVMLEALRLQTSQEDVDPTWAWQDGAIHTNQAGDVMLLIGGTQGQTYINENAHRVFKDLVLNIMEDVNNQSGQPERLVVTTSSHSLVHMVDVEDRIFQKYRIILSFDFLGEQ